MEWPHTLGQQQSAGASLTLDASTSEFANGTVRLGALMAALGLVRLIATLVDYAMIGREAVLTGPFSIGHWLQFIVERPPLLVLIAFWPVVLGLALYRTGWPELLKAGAIAFLVLAISGTLAFLADWGQGRGTIRIGSFRWSPPPPGTTSQRAVSWLILLAGGAQIAGEALAAIRASVLAWKSPSPSRYARDLTSANAARRGRLGTLAMVVSLACLWAPPGLPVWSAYTGLLKKSVLVRDLLLKGDTRRARRHQTAGQNGRREARNYFPLDQSLYRAEAAWESERYVEAHEEYERLTDRLGELPPAKLGDAGWRRAADAFNGYAWLLATCPEVQLRDPAKAVSAARSALALSPENGAIWTTLGIAYFREGNWDEARNALYQSMELSDEGDSRDWFFLAMIYAKLNNPERARGWYDRAVEAASERELGDAELYRFQVEAAEALGLPKPKRAVAPPSRNSLYREMVPRGMPPRWFGPGGPEFPPPDGAEGRVPPFRFPHRGARHFADPNRETSPRRGAGAPMRGSD